MSVVGIDLGTTNTVVACVRGGKVHVLADETGNRLLPSIVSFHPNGEVLTGQPAKARRVIDPKHTIANHKRIIGHSWNSPELVEARQRSPFEMREGPGQGALVHVRGQDYTLPEISAFVLKRARQIAETALGEPVERAVITVPAHFNELQRASTKVAGRISGVEVMRILNEPTAAALAYGLGRGGSERVVIYDFGGGTFDCTLLDLNGNVFEVLASAGDSFLGGDDVDSAIAERMCEYILKTYRFDARSDNQAFERLKVAGETLKMTLSTQEEAHMALDDVGFGVGGAPLNEQFSLKRRELEQLITPLVERSFKVTQDALGLARLSPTSFDRVILVGGSTRIPLVRQRVEAFFGAKPMDKLNPDEVVAVGAAIQAAALVDANRRREIPAPPAVPAGNAPRTMRGTGGEVEDVTEGDVLGRGSESTSVTQGAPTQKKASLPPGKQSSPPGKMSHVPGKMSPGQKMSQVPGKLPAVPGMPGKQSQPPNTMVTQAVNPAGGPNTNPMPTLPRPGHGNEDPSLQSIPDLVPSSPFEWNQNASTLTAQVDSEAVIKNAPRIPSGPGGFGATDEPPSLYSTPSGRAQITSPTATAYPGLAPSPISGFGGPGSDEETQGPFGEVRDLSLVSTTGVTQTQMLDQPPQGREILGRRDARREDPDRFGQVSDDLSLISTSGVSSPSIPSIPSIQERTSPLPIGMSDPTGGEPPRARPARQAAHTTQMANAPEPMQARGNATQMSPARGPCQAPPLPPAAGGRGSTVNIEPSANPARSQPPPPGMGSSPPAAFQSNPPQTGFSQFGSEPPQAAAPPAQQQAPNFSGYGGQQGSAPAAGAAPHGIVPFATFGGPQQPPQPQMSGGMSGLGGSPFGGTTEPPGGASQLQDAASALGGMGAPVLVDVTPRALIVETAGGYGDTVIPRNSKIPCERMRKFSTSRDGQTAVRIRIGQGESTRFAENTYLGEVELGGLRVASRGDVTIAVSFELDADGTLRVRAWDTITLQEAKATLQLIGIADESSVVMMINRFALQPGFGPGGGPGGPGSPLGGPMQ